MFGISKQKKRVYLDYAGATPIVPEATKAVVANMRLFANPSAIHTQAVETAQSLTASRERVAHHFGCKSRDIIFTSGGTESNNLAVLGFARSIVLTRQTLAHTHWIVSAIEHPSVLDCFGEVERLGGSVTFVEPNKKGIVAPDAIGRALRPETVFVSVGWGNGEIGVVQPLGHIARELRTHEEKHKTKIIFHSDAGQAPLYEAAHVHSLGVDLLSLDAAKLYGPRGVGALYVSERTELSRIMFGGSQERGLRAGTANVALAAGFSVALDVVVQERTLESRRLRVLRDAFAQKLLTHIPGLVINGNLSESLPHILNISIPNIQGEYYVLAMDHAGFAVSTKSACREGRESRSHVVEALGGEEWHAQNTIRFSLGRDTTERDLERTLEVLISLCTH